MKSAFEALSGVLSSHAQIPPGVIDSAPPKRRKGPRREQIEAEHRSALSRAYLYRQQLAASHEELAALDREYQRRMAEGPDFTQHRRKSRFGQAPQHKLTRDDIAALRYRFNSMARQSWERRPKGKHRGIFSRTSTDVFRALLWLAEKYDRLFPSVERLAHLAQCSPRSVATALAVLERCGLLTRHRRIKLVEGLLGRKAEQDTNGYELHPPRAGRGVLAWLFSFMTESDCKNRGATVSVCFSYLKEHPEIWGGVSVARGDACGGPPMAAHS